MKTSKYSFLVVFFTLLLVAMLGYLLTNKYNNENQFYCENTSDKYNCWRDSLNNALKKGGLVASYDLLAHYYETDSGFVSECHGFTHELGQKSYELYRNDKKISLSPKVSYCGYGFYHGFVETLLHLDGDISEAEKFCEYADNELSSFSKKTNVACYHGIGHGAVDGSGKLNWDNPQDFISAGLKICITVSKTPDQVYQCGTGVFNSLAIALNSYAYNLNFSGNPYQICSSQEDQFKRACFEQMNTRISGLSNSDLSLGVKYVLEIKDKKYSAFAMDQLAPATIASRVGKNENFDKEIMVCKSLPENLAKPCIEGLAGGILEFGKPDYEYIEALKLCESGSMNESDKEICYKYIASSLGILYSSDRVDEICKNVDSKYRIYCKTN